MSIAADIAAFVARLDAAIDSAMQGPVLDGAKKQIQDTARSRVYSAYQPQFYSRRMMSGGLMDEGNMESNYGDKTLMIKDVAGWQQLYGGAYPGEELAEAIAAGSPQNGQGNKRLSSICVATIYPPNLFGTHNLFRCLCGNPTTIIVVCHTI